MVARWEVFSSTTSEMGGRQSRQNGAARRNFALVVLAGACVLLLAGSQISGPGRSRVELLSEGLDERQMAKNMRLKKQVATRRVSSMHLVADIKKVLLDVETNLQRRRIRRYFPAIVLPIRHTRCSNAAGVRASVMQKFISGILVPDGPCGHGRSQVLTAGLAGRVVEIASWWRGRKAQMSRKICRMLTTLWTV